MKYRTILKTLFVPLLACVILVACKKGEDITDLGDTGNTFIKLLGGGGDAGVIAMTVDPAVETISLLDVRRDANNSASLNQPATITITNTQVFLDSFNAHNGTHYELLPTSAYTITPASGVTVSGDTWTINLAPGEAAREIQITLDKSAMDLSLAYGFGFQVTQTTSGSISQSAGTHVVNPLIINQYDGMYSIESGTVTRYTSPGNPAGDALSGDIAGNPDLALATVGPTTVEIQGLQWAFGNNVGVGGINNLRASINPTTNLVTMSAVGNPTLTNWSGHDNYYDPATQTFHLSFIWNPTANVRTYEMVIKYSGPR